MKTQTRIIGIILAIIMLLGMTPAAVFAGDKPGGTEPGTDSEPSAAPGEGEGGEETPYYTVVAYGGTVTLVSGEQNAAGKFAEGSVVLVELDYASYAGHTFDCWKSSEGDLIPQASFRLIVERDAYFGLSFSDVTPAWGEWELLYDSGDCTVPTIYVRYDTASGLAEYKQVVYESHDFGVNTYVDEDTCRQVCSRCGCIEDGEHWWSTEEIVTPATHSSDGLKRATCYQCGATVDTVIPRTDEHVWGADVSSDYGWEIITPSVDGNYGVRRRHCLYCDAYEDYWYLDVDFASLFAGKDIRYKETYGGKLTNNERYFCWTEGNLTYYIYAVQYVYAYSTGNDYGQTWAFMFIDDGDPTNLKSVYLSKTTGSSSVSGYTWAEYGNAYDFEDWLYVIRRPDFAFESAGNTDGIYLSNTMSARASLLTAWGDDWKEEYNKLMIPASADPDSFIYTGDPDSEASWYKWQVYAESEDFACRATVAGYDANNEAIWENSGGFDTVTYRRWVSGTGDDGDPKVYDYLTVDKESGVCVSKEVYTTAYSTIARFTLYDDMQTTDHTEIAALIRSFSGEQNRSQFSASFSLEVPDPLQAARVIVGGDFASADGRDWSFLYNDGRCFRIQRTNDTYYNLTLTWTGDTSVGWVFDRWEIYDFQTFEWSTFSTAPETVINTYQNPLTGLTLVRAISHQEPIDDSIRVTVTGGTFQVKTSGNTYYYESEGDVAKGAYVVPLDDSDLCPEGKQFDHWEIYQGGVLVTLTPFTFQWSRCYELWEDTDFVAVYVDEKYYVSVDVYNGTAYLEEDLSEPFYGGEFEAGTELHLTTVGDEGYPYFYGWYRIDYKDKGEVEELVSTDTDVTVTVTAGYGVYYRAIWGETEERPRDDHDIIMRYGFVQSDWGLKVSALRVSSYKSVSFFTEPGNTTEYSEWKLVGTLDGSPWTDSCEASADYDYEGWYYVRGMDEAPATIHVTAITAAGGVTYGDVNDDGEITAKDAALVKQYIANYDDDEAASAVALPAEGAADVNDDGNINGRDAVLIMQYVANYDDDTGTSTIVLGPAPTAGTIPG